MNTNQEQTAARRSCLLGAFVVFLVLPACAFGTTTITYDDAIAPQLVFDAMPPQQRDKLVVQQRIIERGICDWGCNYPLKIWVISQGKRIDIPLANGLVVGAPDESLVGRGLPVRSNSPLRLGLETGLHIKPPGGQAVPVGYFLDCFRQVNRFIYRFVRHQKGFFRALLAPEISRFSVFYTATTAGDVQLREGSRLMQLPDNKPGQDPALLQRDFLAEHKKGILLFSTPISEVDIENR